MLCPICGKEGESTALCKSCAEVTILAGVCDVCKVQTANGVLAHIAELKHEVEVYKRALRHEVIEKLERIVCLDCYDNTPSTILVDKNIQEVLEQVRKEIEKEAEKSALVNKGHEIQNLERSLERCRGRKGK